MTKRIFIVTGASGKLGMSFIQELQKRGEVIIAFTRKEVEIEGVKIEKADLLNEGEITTAFNEMDLSDSNEIYLIHAVGKFKFEGNAADIIDLDNDGIDDEVYATNVLTLKNTIKALLARCTTQAKIKICAFASVSDKHDIPFWNSYTKSKNIIRGYLKELCRSARMQALVVNVTTVDTGNENDLRPHADKTYWLTPDEIVAKVLPELISLSTYKEIDMIKEKPDFDSNYYLDHEAILKKWKSEMGEE